MRIYTVTKCRAPESLSFVPTNLAARQVNTLFKKGKNREFSSGLCGLKIVFVSSWLRRKETRVFLSLDEWFRLQVGGKEEHSSGESSSI